MINIVNLKNYKPKGEVTEHYIDRETTLGNPFIIGKDGNRQDVIIKYEKWLVEKLIEGGSVSGVMKFLYNNWKQHGKLTLMCWCYPKPCHGNIIRRYLEYYNRFKQWR